MHVPYGIRTDEAPRAGAPTARFLDKCENRRKLRRSWGNQRAGCKELQSNPVGQIRPSRYRLGAVNGLRIIPLQSLVKQNLGAAPFLYQPTASVKIDVNWEREGFRLANGKTGHPETGGVRRVPTIPELRPHLEKALDLAPEEALFVRCGRAPVAGGQSDSVTPAHSIGWPHTGQSSRRAAPGVYPFG
jgi:hypothetical protein